MGSFSAFTFHYPSICPSSISHRLQVKLEPIHMARGNPITVHNRSPEKIVKIIEKHWRLAGSEPPNLVRH